MTSETLKPRRRPWRALSREEKQAALTDLRRRQRHQVEVEARELRAVRRRRLR